MCVPAVCFSPELGCQREVLKTLKSFPLTHQISSVIVCRVESGALNEVGYMAVTPQDCSLTDVFVEKEVGGRIKRVQMILHCQLHSWLFNSTNHRQAAFTAQGCFVPPVLKAQGKRGEGAGADQTTRPLLPPHQVPSSQLALIWFFPF